jgi:hypothetical protein
MSDSPVILMRPSLSEEEEMKIAGEYFPVYRLRSQIPYNSLVIGRYSVLPYYRELEEDLETKGCSLINSYYEHRWIADLREWYTDLEGLTPKTWFSLESIPQEGPFVLKGSTNSRKFEWNTHMFARNKREAVEVYRRLSQDGMIGEQGIYIREYVPLRHLADGFNGLPISEEYRFFILDGEVISGAFYWSSHVDDLQEKFSPDRVPQSFLKQVIKRIRNRARFLVLDVGITATGAPIVIEINDGQMSGPSENDLHQLYERLHAKLGAPLGK